VSIRIVTSNVSDGATLSSSDFVGTLPVSNLQVEGRARVARTTNATGTKTVNGDFAAASVVGSCVLYNHNLTIQATWRLRMWDAAGQAGNLVYDSGTVTALPALGWGEFGWGLVPWGASVFTGWGAAFSVLWFPAVGALSFRLELTDAANPAGYLQAKRLLVGPYFEPGVNVSYGLQLYWEDNSEQRRTQGGSLRTDARVRYRCIKGELGYLNPAERAVAVETLRQIALRTETFVSVFPGYGGAQERDYSLLGKFTSMPQFTHGQPSSHSAQLAFEEV
jgi:hypothetical protein